MSEGAFSPRAGLRIKTDIAPAKAPNPCRPSRGEHGDAAFFAVDSADRHNEDREGECHAVGNHGFHFRAPFGCFPEDGG